MKNVFRQCYGIAIVVIILFSSTSNLSAQNESGVRPVDSANYQGTGWWRPADSMYQVRYPIIRSIPPLSSGMSYEVLLSYISTDSLLRFAPSQKAVENRIKAWTSVNDTLRRMMQALYYMSDYNPIIFTQYRDEVTHYRKSHGNGFIGQLADTATYVPSTWQLGRYEANLNEIIRILTAKFFYLHQNVAERNPMYAIANCDYIMKVRILSIDSTVNKNAPTYEHVYRVRARVLDTLKGRVYLNNTFTDDAPTIQFQYSPEVYMPYGSWSSDREEGDVLRDPAFIGQRGTFRMLPNQEAIVFLSHKNPQINKSYDFYDLKIDVSGSNGALPLINGEVRDVNKFWLQNELNSYQDWKYRFIELRNKIKNGQY